MLFITCEVPQATSCLVPLLNKSLMRFDKLFFLGVFNNVLKLDLHSK
jgi:hypothetical protein